MTDKKTLEAIQLSRVIEHMKASVEDAEYACRMANARLDALQGQLSATMTIMKDAATRFYEAVKEA